MISDPATTPAALRYRAEQHAATLPPLLAEARHLAASVLLGEHGRRRAGVGDEFWQYRPAERGDGLRDIDWRRSARSDAHFVRQKEWQAAQTVMFWVDQAQSMGFSGDRDRPTKGHRARVLSLALSVLLSHAGERFGLADRKDPPGRGEAHLSLIARDLMEGLSGDEYGAPNPRLMPAGSCAVFLSDFLGAPGPAEKALTMAADRGVSGALVQILDPDEESFPFDGRTVFESMTGALEFETLKAGTLREAYLERLAARKAHLKQLCSRTGWRYICHHTDRPATQALLWLYQILERT